MKQLVLFVGLATLGACGASAWQPMNAEVPRVVYVDEPCRLATLKLEPAPVRGHCADASACYDSQSAAVLARRIKAMQHWIDDARHKCGIMEYDRASYRLLPPYRRGSLITTARLRLTGGAGMFPGAR